MCFDGQDSRASGFKHAEAAGSETWEAPAGIGRIRDNPASGRQRSSAMCHSKICQPGSGAYPRREKVELPLALLVHVGRGDARGALHQSLLHAGRVEQLPPVMTDRIQAWQTGRTWSPLSRKWHMHTQGRTPRYASHHGGAAHPKGFASSSARCTVISCAQQSTGLVFEFVSVGWSVVIYVSVRLAERQLFRRLPTSSPLARPRPAGRRPPAATGDATLVP